MSTNAQPLQEAPYVLLAHGYTGAWPPPCDVPWPTTRVRAQRRFNAPALGRPRLRHAAEFDGTIIDLLEEIAERHSRKAAHEEAVTTLGDLCDAMSAWWSQIGCKTNQTRTLIRRGMDVEDIRGTLIESLIRKQQHGWKSKYDPSRLLDAGDPLDAYCGIVARGALSHMLAKQDRLVLDHYEDDERDRDNQTESPWSEPFDDDDESIGLTTIRRASYSSDDTEKPDRDRPPVVIRRRG